MLLVLFLMGLFIFTADFYLIAGSDVVDFSHTYPLWLRGVFAAALVVLVFLFLSGNKLRCVRIGIGLLIVLSVISSQALVVSGKTNTISGYLYGVKFKSITYDPGVGYQGLVKKTRFGYTLIGDNYISFVLLTGFCPVCINLEGM